MIRLRLKIVYLLPDTFLKLKLVKTGVLREWGFKFYLRFRRHFFRHTKLGDWWVLEKIFCFYFGLKGVRDKCVGCFLTYLFFWVERGVFFIKVLRDERFHFCAKSNRWVAAIHTTCDLSQDVGRTEGNFVILNNLQFS